MNKNNISEGVIDTIDASMVPMIKYLNDNGIRTFACCSGDLREHDYRDGIYIAYVAFQDSEQVRSLLSVLMNKKFIEVSVASAPKEPYEYFGQEITRKRLGFYFNNTHGENMDIVFGEVKRIVEQKIESPENLRILNAVMRKLDEQEKELDYDVNFNSWDNPGRTKISFSSRGLCEDEESVLDVDKLTCDVQEALAPEETNKVSGDVVLNGALAENPAPALDFLKKLALSNKGKYTMPRSMARKPYEELESYDDIEWDEEEYEYQEDSEYETEDEFLDFLSQGESEGKNDAIDTEDPII